MSGEVQRQVEEGTELQGRLLSIYVPFPAIVILLLGVILLRVVLVWSTPPRRPIKCYHQPLPLIIRSHAHW